MVMVKCAFCGKKIKKKKAIEITYHQYTYWFGIEEDREIKLYFCSKEHLKAWELLDHLQLFAGDRKKVEEHLVNMHGWTREDVERAYQVLTGGGI